MTMSLDRRDYEEKRGFIRMPVACEISLEDRASGRSFQASARNLSASGVLFATDQPLQRGDRLEMRIEAHQALLSVLEASIEVLRVEPAGDGRSCNVGCLITRMNSDR
jgi:hypothetical protein